jgi:hypothetical protein
LVADTAVDTRINTTAVSQPCKIAYFIRKVPGMYGASIPVMTCECEHAFCSGLCSAVIDILL